jgi:hypothetical protein
MSTATKYTFHCNIYKESVSCLLNFDISPESVSRRNGGKVHCSGNLKRYIRSPGVSSTNQILNTRRNSNTPIHIDLSSPVRAEHLRTTKHGRG